MIQLGKYQHFKGGLYEVIGEGLHSETNEPMVIYKSLYEIENFPSGSIWIRPREMFLDKVEVNGETAPRFKYIEDEPIS